MVTTFTCARCRRTMGGGMRAVDGKPVCSGSNTRGCAAIVADRAAHPGYYAELKTCARESLPDTGDTALTSELARERSRKIAAQEMADAGE